MKRRVLRFFLGVGYVLLLTAMLLYQLGTFGGRRSKTGLERVTQMRV